MRTYWVEREYCFVDEHRDDFIHLESYDLEISPEVKLLHWENYRTHLDISLLTPSLEENSLRARLEEVHIRSRLCL